MNNQQSVMSKQTSNEEDQNRAYDNFLSVIHQNWTNEIPTKDFEDFTRKSNEAEVRRGQ